ncbi:MAG TPA: DUF4129 domain-containing protein [Ktedonobacterales bacterium]|nr:DUF4129 domain-containing protein [Ktedonobacterales bacterium]
MSVPPIPPVTRAPSHEPSEGDGHDLPYDPSIETTGQSAPVSDEREAPTDESERQSHRVSRRQERSARLVELLMAVALEALPATAWLLVFAAIAGTVGAVALPFWWIVIVLLAGWGVAALLRRLPPAERGSDLAPRGVKLLAVAGWIVTVLISLALSPAAYLGTPPHEWLAAISADLLNGTGRLGADVGLAFLVAYLWWRGLLLGRLPLTRDRIYIRFLWGLAAVVLAIVGSAALQGNMRTAVAAALALLLPAEVFAGLVGIALAQLIDSQEERSARRRRVGQDQTNAPRSTITRAWLVSALGISGGIVLSALVLALIVSYNGLRELAALLQPLANALGTVIAWLIEGLAFLLFLLLNGPITWIKDHVQSSPHNQNTPPASTRPRAPTFTPHTLPHAWLVAGSWVLIALGLALLAVLLMLVLRRFQEWRQQPEYEEERETMDVAAALGRQLRGLLAGLRGRHAVAGVELEPLPEGSVRLLYREMLEQASAAGYARRPSETPDEYAQRLRTVTRQEMSHLTLPPGLPGPPDFDESLAALTDAYDPARYRRAQPPAGDNDKATPPVVAAYHAVLAWLAARASA